MGVDICTDIVGENQVIEKKELPWVGFEPTTL
jgi:hypothetical protein